MASWTNQSTSSLLPGEPWTSAKALAAFENPTAITEGAAGAPKIRTAAMQPPTSGNTTIKTMENISATYTSPATSASVSLAEGSVGVLVPGTIRVVCTVATSGTISSRTVTFTKNGTTFATFTTDALHFSDVAVTLGDRINITATVSGTGANGTVSLTGVRIESGTADFAVA